MTAPVTYVQIQSRAAVTVQELKTAWHTFQAGQLHCLRPTWEPDEAVLPVVGCAGSVGASTLSLALATTAAAAIGATRVVECCTVTASGLAAASTAELGQQPSGWMRGTRDRVLLERGSAIFLAPAEVPIPADTQQHPVVLTILDVGWELGQLLAGPSWLADQLLQARHVVAVTTATIPGLRRLEGALGQLDGIPVAVAVLGPGRHKWPQGVEHSMGPLTRQLDQARGLHHVPLDRDLATRGLDSKALPAALLTSAGRLLHATGAGVTRKGNP